MAVTCLSLIMGILGTAAYLLVRSIFVGQLPEAVMVSRLIDIDPLGMNYGNV